MRRTFKFVHLNLRWRIGQSSEPRIPDVGVSTPMRMRADGCMLSVVLPKRTAVDVIVANPGQEQISKIIRQLDK